MTKFTGRDLLGIMKYPHKFNRTMFGDEIVGIESATDEFCIKYFEKRLANLMIYEALNGTPYFTVTYSGKGDPQCCIYKGNFNLTIDMCQEIYNFLSRCSDQILVYHEYNCSFDIELPPYLQRIILRYIDNKGELKFSDFNLMVQYNGHIEYVMM